MRGLIIMQGKSTPKVGIEMIHTVHVAGFQWDTTSVKYTLTRASRYRSDTRTTIGEHEDLPDEVLFIKFARTISGRENFLSTTPPQAVVSMSMLPTYCLPGPPAVYWTHGCFKPRRHSEIREVFSIGGVNQGAKKGNLNENIFSKLKMSSHPCQPRNISNAVNISNMGHDRTHSFLLSRVQIGGGNFV